MVIKIESFTFILTKTPRNINNANPPDDIIKTGLYFKPITKPTPPIISSIAVIVPNFSSPNLLNSLFIFVEVK